VAPESTIQSMIKEFKEFLPVEDDSCALGSAESPLD